MYQLTIVTPEEILYQESISSLIAPGSQGYLGILTNHAPLITPLVPGKLTLKDTNGKEKVLAITGGFMEVFKNQVTILADAVESANDIDIERAKKAFERAKRRLKEKKGDIPRAIRALRRAENRIRICQQMYASQEE